MPPGRGSSVTARPIQRIIFSGSTKKAKTISGRAAICTLRSRMSLGCSAMVVVPPLFGFSRLFELREATIPKLIEKRPEIGQPFLPCAVKPPGALAAHAHQASSGKHLEVL